MKQSGSYRKSEQRGKDKILEHHFNEVRREDYSETFPAVENWLYKTNILLENKKNERKLQKMKNFLFANKLRLAYTVVALAVIVAACNMPVTQTETAGHVLSWTVPMDNTDTQAKINSLPWLKDAQLTVNENIRGEKTELLYTAVLPNSTEKQMDSYRRELEAIDGITSLKITPIDYDVKRPLYSAALHDFFSISIDATGMSDEELEQKVQTHLKEHGINMKIQFKTDANGKRSIFIEKSEENKLKEPRSFELNIDDNNGNEKIKLFTKKVDPEKFKGKTDEEIRKMVKENHPELQDKDIKIERNGDKVQVKVEVERKEK